MRPSAQSLTQIEYREGGVAFLCVSAQWGVTCITLVCGLFQLPIHADCIKCGETPRPRSTFDRGLGWGSLRMLGEEELARNLAPLLRGHLRGQIMYSWASVLSDDTGESRHAKLQPAGGIGHPLACQAAVEEVAEADLQIGRDHGNEPALSVWICVGQGSIGGEGVVDVRNFAFDRGNQISALAVADNRGEFLALPQPLAALWEDEAVEFSGKPRAKIIDSHANQGGAFLQRPSVARVIAPIIGQLKTCYKAGQHAGRKCRRFFSSLCGVWHFLAVPQVIDGEEDREHRKHQNDCHGPPPGFLMYS